MALSIMEKEIVLTEDTQIIVATYNDVISYVKCCHIYKNVWTPRLQEQLHGDIEQNNPVASMLLLLKRLDK